MEIVALMPPSNVFFRAFFLYILIVCAWSRIFLNAFLLSSFAFFQKLDRHFTFFQQVANTGLNESFFVLFFNSKFMDLLDGHGWGKYTEC